MLTDINAALQRNDTATTMDLLGMTLAEEELPPCAGTRMGRTRGIVVREVGDDSMARRVGIKAGDVVAEADNLPVETLRVLDRILAEHQPFEPIYILFLRQDRWQLKILNFGELAKEHH